MVLYKYTFKKEVHCMVKKQDYCQERGKPKTIYIKPSVEKKALEFCEAERISLSLLIKMALEAYMSGRTK